MSEPQATEAPVAVPPDTDAKRLVEAIHRQACSFNTDDWMGLAYRLTKIRVHAERLAVLLDERDAEVDEAWEKYAVAANALADYKAALEWALPYLAEVPLPADNQRQRDRYASKLNAAEQLIRAARGGGA